MTIENEALVREFRRLAQDIAIRVAVFDVDGVILDSEAGSIWATNQALTLFGGEPISLDWYQQNHLGSFCDMLVARGVPAEKCEELLLALDDFFCLAEYPERPGARQVLSYFSERGLPIHFASACNRALTIEKIGRHAGLADFVSATYGGERKAAAFLQIAEEMKIAPANILFVTDMGRDIEEAELAGVQYVFTITSGFSSRQQLAAYGYPIVHHHEELMDLLRLLF